MIIRNLPFELRLKVYDLLNANDLIGLSECGLEELVGFRDLVNLFDYDPDHIFPFLRVDDYCLKSAEEIRAVISVEPIIQGIVVEGLSCLGVAGSAKGINNSKDNSKVSKVISKVISKDNSKDSSKVSKDSSKVSKVSKVSIKGTGDRPLISKITHLDLRGQNIRVEGAREIAIAAKFGKLQRLRVLDLSLNDIGVMGAKEISKVLKLSSLSLITHLNLTHNGLGVGGAKSIAHAIRTSKCTDTLRYLYLEFNNMKYSGISAIIDAISKAVPLNHVNSNLHHLIYLNVENNRMGDLITSSSSINTNMNNNTDNNDLNLYSIRNISHLSLGYNQIGDQDMVSIFHGCHSDSVSHLSLINNNIGDDGVLELTRLVRIGGWPALRNIDLQGNLVTTIGAMHLIQEILRVSKTSTWNLNFSRNPLLKADDPRISDLLLSHNNRVVSINVSFH